MATGKAAQIPDALLARLTTLQVGSPALPIAYPDVGFDPASDAPDGKYIDADFKRNVALWEGLSAGVIDQGLFQLDVVWPKGAGVIAPNEAAQQVANHFAKDLVLVSGATRVKLNKEPVIASPLIEAHETRIPITISWVA